MTTILQKVCVFANGLKVLYHGHYFALNRNECEQCMKLLSLENFNSRRDGVPFFSSPKCFYMSMFVPRVSHIYCYIPVYISISLNKKWLILF